MAEGVKFTLCREVDEDGNPTDTLELKIDDILFKKYPYLDIKYGECVSTNTHVFSIQLTVLVLLVLDEDKQQIIRLGFKVDGITVFGFGSYETWSRAMFV